MSEPSVELLSDVLGTVLQDAAFVFAEPLEGPPVFDGPVLQATIAFESVRGGALRLTVGTRGGAEIAGNMLGLEPGDPEAVDQARAAVSEILNVIGGAFITRYFGTQVPSQLGLPTTHQLDAAPSVDLAHAAALQLECGDPLVLELDLEGVARA